MPIRLLYKLRIQINNWQVMSRFLFYIRHIYLLCLNDIIKHQKRILNIVGIIMHLIIEKKHKRAYQKPWLLRTQICKCFYRLRHYWHILALPHYHHKHKFVSLRLLRLRSVERLFPLGQHFAEVQPQSSNNMSDR